ncbi:hypothetical protein GLOTRDRAFT_103414 [Gloeophyllum trabeum ATCC 11539]|uniref:BCD1 alpha/beta domain-containing protein n=1 Tax=Gloeophyllum trabeum (strain ATCC 11539 / FP-39264 / Madison 617) TaxID=670483 RepID=S7RWW7_GLOTA|nr:uncharacterized protein GLOTRDRAFT_103414 [Gloeophyllum trabeum ATCC 11539]EPQ59390.1 hypothetical protein GLOTRDRAFT_103414 [Gloeophyllum trabeum ATCC 11539]
MQLDFRDIDMELLPDGMEKRKLNQSAWDFKNQTALLTIEFKFHPPPDPLALAGQSHPTVTLLTHRNDINTSLLALLQKQVTERPKGKKEKGTPAWVKSLVMPDPDDPEGFVIPTCVMPAPSGIATNLTRQPKTGYYKFDPTQKLSSLLRNKSFVEYPCIEIFEDGSFHGTVIDDSGAIQVGEDERKPKRRKIDVKAIRGLLGGYGSADEEEERNVLITLGDYGGSDAETDMPSRLDEGEVAGGDEGGEGVDEVEGDDIDPEDTTTLDDDAPGEEVNYEELVAKVKAAQSLEDEEDLDWGQSDDDDKLEQVVRTAAQEILRAQGM